MAGNRGAVAGLTIVRAVVWLVYALASAAIIVLAFAFVLLMLDANPNNTFAVWITQWGSTFAGPFVGLIRPTPLSNGGVVAWSLLVAIAAYAVVAWIVGALLGTVSGSLSRARHGRSEAVGVRSIPSGDIGPAVPAAPAQSSAPVQASPVSVTVDQGAPASATAPEPAPAAAPSAGPGGIVHDGPGAGDPTTTTEPAMSAAGIEPDSNRIAGSPGDPAE